MGHCFFLNSIIISWYNKKQQILSTFIIKAKYIMLGHIVREKILIKKFLNKLKIDNIIGVYTLYKNNETSIILTKNAKNQVQIKHIDM